MIDSLLSALFIFAMRVADMSLDTLRVLFMMRGRKLTAGIIGATQAAIFVIAISRVITQLNNPWNVVGYSLGFGVGVIVGMLFEERLAIGFGQMRVISSTKGHALADALRAKGYAVTELPGRGKDGMVTVLNLTVRRKDVEEVQKVVRGVDEAAFITIEDVRPLWRGYF
ncbi:MAG TPA: DUF5698 domain-containing protein [Anaerolineales bacterium]|nr:DUF5698 domain-containing protein [Anaerolineales bacterium]